MESPSRKVFKERGRGTGCRGLFDKVVFGFTLDFMISDVFSNKLIPLRMAFALFTSCLMCNYEVHLLDSGITE